MVDVFVDDPLLFAIGHVNFCLNDLDGSVGAVVFTDRATGASVFIVFVMRHDYFTLEAVEHLQCLPVFRILLGHDLSGTEKISRGYAHPLQERRYGAEYIRKVFEKAVHSFLKMPTH